MTDVLRHRRARGCVNSPYSRSSPRSTGQHSGLERQHGYSVVTSFVPARRPAEALARLGLAQSLVGAGETTLGRRVAGRNYRPCHCRRSVPSCCRKFVYCAVIEACFDVFDLPRAQDWTVGSQPLVRGPNRIWSRTEGQCQVHRALDPATPWCSERMAVMAVPGPACRRLADPPDQPALGARGYYQQGELHRLCRLEYAKAEAA